MENTTISLQLRQEIHLTLKLFGVIREDDHSPGKPVESLLQEGYYVPATPKVTAVLPRIIEELRERRLSGDELNRTFFDSWRTIIDMSQRKRLMHQIVHYFTTYGLGGDTPDTIYLPQQAVDIPEFDPKKFPLIHIRLESTGEITERILTMFRSGMAMKAETMNEAFKLLELMGVELTRDQIDTIANREALVLACDKYHLTPSDPVEALRLLIYKLTGETLLIKSTEMITLIKTKDARNAASLISSMDPETMASIFYRYKALFLALKHCKSDAFKVWVNKIRRLAPQYHRPLQEGILDRILDPELDMELLEKGLVNATVFRVMRVWKYLALKQLSEGNNVYRIRNGKVWMKKTSGEELKADLNLYIARRIKVGEELIRRLSHLKGKRVLMTRGLTYALPTSEKAFVGKYPEGTYFDVVGSAMVGVYWREDWGANDNDLSAISTGSKIGWNSSDRTEGNTLVYSGDITSAPSGAAEWMQCNNGLDKSYLLFNNVYSGAPDSQLKLMVAKTPVGNTWNYICDPNDVLFEAEIRLTGRGSVLALVLPIQGGMRVVLMQRTVSRRNVSSSSEINEILRQYLSAEAIASPSLSEVLVKAGVDIVHDDSQPWDIDLRGGSVTASTFMKLFEVGE
jgi:hypothetical protein